MTPRLIHIIEAGNTLGEGVQWFPPTKSLFWTDIQNRSLYRYDMQGEQLSQYDTPERLCSFGFYDDNSTLISAFENGFARYNYHTQALDWLNRPETSVSETRFNDGKVDRQGRFWAGTMVEKGDPAVQTSGNLYCLNGDLETQQHERNIGISNGICWSPDADRFYFADSRQRTIYRYGFDPESGSLSDRQVFVETENGVFPDGAEVDSNGCVWSAHWGAGRVVRYTPDGQIDMVISLPVSQPTCVTFGGSNFDLLFVTTAKENLDESQLRKEPHAGDVFVYFLGNITGLPATYFTESIN